MKRFNQDLQYMKLALFLAKKGKGWTSPNPCVGAVIVKNGKIIGYGYHQGPGKPHAEAIAIREAGSLTQGSTLYLNLEPCVHYGRTPPCVEKIINSGIKRLVISTYDPNPLVNKKGVERLRKEGIQVSIGLLENEARKLNEIYFKYIVKKIPFVALKAGISLDGKIATQNFKSKWITSTETRDYTHLLRGEFDCILVGINTILYDNPLLTIRHPLWSSKKIKRAILDTNLQFPEKSRIVKTLSDGEIIIYTSPNSSKKKIFSLREKGIDIVQIPIKNGNLCLVEVLKDLGSREVSSVLVEGGGEPLGSFLSEKLADKIFLFISPKIIGGEKAPSIFPQSKVEELKSALTLKNIKFFRIKNDIIFEGYL